MNVLGVCEVRTLGGEWLVEVRYTPLHLSFNALSCDGMSTPLFNHVCVTVCLSTPLLKCPFEKGLCPVPWGGWFQNDLSITGRNKSGKR